jgi:hypothetical protein
VLTLLNRDPIFVTFRDNSVVITGVHREDLTQAQCDAARVKLIQTLHQIAPGVIGDVIGALTVDPAPRELVYPMTTQAATVPAPVAVGGPVPAEAGAATEAAGTGYKLARPAAASPVAGRATVAAVTS